MIVWRESKRKQIESMDKWRVWERNVMQENLFTYTYSFNDQPTWLSACLPACLPSMQCVCVWVSVNEPYREELLLYSWLKNGKEVFIFMPGADGAVSGENKLLYDTEKYVRIHQKQELRPKMHGKSPKSVLLRRRRQRQTWFGRMKSGWWVCLFLKRGIKSFRRWCPCSLNSYSFAALSLHPSSLTPQKFLLLTRLKPERERKEAE